MPSGQSPKFYPTLELKSKLMRPALTSHYAVYFTLSQLLNKPGASTFFKNRQSDIGGDGELLTLSCSEANLPGSSLATHEINNDFTGVTERHAYRRQYDDRIDFTFYVDHDYKIIKFFETWMSWIVGEDQFREQDKPNYSYRVKFPNDYKIDFFVQKFEKDFSGYIEYKFIGGYPISITSMPVSYDSSQLLKCTVSMSYVRYYIDNPVKLSDQKNNPNPNSPGNPEQNTTGVTLGDNEIFYREINGVLFGREYWENALGRANPNAQTRPAPTPPGAPGSPGNPLPLQVQPFRR